MENDKKIWKIIIFDCISGDFIEAKQVMGTKFDVVDVGSRMMDGWLQDGDSLQITHHKDSVSFDIYPLVGGPLDIIARARVI